MKKYTPGQRITSVDELLKQDMIYVIHGEHIKPYHKGWFLSWPLRTALRYLESGVLYRADKIREADNGTP